MHLYHRGWKILLCSGETIPPKTAQIKLHVWGTGDLQKGMWGWAQLTSQGHPTQCSPQPAPRQSLRKAKINPKPFPEEQASNPPLYISPPVLLTLNKANNSGTHNTELISIIPCPLPAVVHKSLGLDATLPLCFVILGFFPSAGVQWAQKVKFSSLLSLESELLSGRPKTTVIGKWIFSFQVLKTPDPAKLSNKCSWQNYQWLFWGEKWISQLRIN